MILDRRDTEILRLSGKYRWLPYDSLGVYGFPGLAEAVELLIKTGYIGVSRSKRYMKLAQKGVDYLERHGYSYEPFSKRAYANSPALRRRLEVSRIMLACLRAGIDTLPDGVDDLGRQPVFLPAFDLRTGGTNVLGNATCAGFGHWGGTAYIFHYIGERSCGVYLVNELGVFHRLSSVFAGNLQTPKAMIFAGTSYSQIHELLRERAASKRETGGLVSFSETYRKSELPIHLLSCGETGALQLALMRQPDYNARVARAACGQLPRDAQIPFSDGLVGDSSLVIAADMNVRRILKVCEYARQLGKRKVMIAAFGRQLDDFLYDAFPPDDIISHFCIDRQILDAAFQDAFYLRDMECDDDAQTL